VPDALEDAVIVVTRRTYADHAARHRTSVARPLLAYGETLSGLEACVPLTPGTGWGGGWDTMDARRGEARRCDRMRWMACDEMGWDSHRLPTSSWYVMLSLIGTSRQRASTLISAALSERACFLRPNTDDLLHRGCSTEATPPRRTTPPAQSPTRKAGSDTCTSHKRLPRR
jgi:hypothetical protein